MDLGISLELASLIVKVVEFHQPKAKTSLIILEI